MGSDIIIVAICSVIVVGLIASIVSATRPQQDTARVLQSGYRLAQIEHKLDCIMKHLGIEYVDETASPIRDQLRAGNKINAIKLYREQYGVGLKEAKDAVDAMAREDGVI